MDGLTKERSLARHALFHVEHARKRHHNGNAIEGRSERMDFKGAYNAAASGADMAGIGRALNGVANMPMDDEPRMQTEVAGSSYCMSYGDLMPAVGRRMTVGDQVQPIANMMGVRYALEGDIDNDGF